MEVSAVNTTTSTTNNNNNANNNPQLISPDDGLQSQQLIIRAKSISNNNSHANNNIINASKTNDNAMTLKHISVQYQEIHTSPSFKSCLLIPPTDQVDVDVRETLRQIVDDVNVQDILNQHPTEQNPPLQEKVGTDTPEFASSTIAEDPAEVQKDYLNINSTNADSTTVEKSPQSSGDDDATCDLIIDSSLPSNEPQEMSVQQEPDRAQLESTTETEQSTTEPNATKNIETTMIIERNTSQPSDQDSRPKNDDGAHVPAKTMQSGETYLLKSDTSNHNNGSPSREDSPQPTSKLEGVSSENNQVVVRPDDDPDDSHEGKLKDMVVLRNLEISPPPNAIESGTKIEEKTEVDTTQNDLSSRQSSKRKRPTASESSAGPNETAENVGRSKRQRTQTKLFQVGESSHIADTSLSIISSTSSRKNRPSARSRKKSTASSTSDANLSTAQDNIIQHAIDQPDVIYDKNDYLAVRNEYNTFYLCQLTENVRIKRPQFKVRWFDTKDDGQTYYLTSQYDMVPRQSILMPVELNKVKSEKKSEQLFTLDDQVKDIIMERLKKSLIAQSGSSQESSIEG